MTIEQPNLGNEGDTCPECGSTLATDQRYCLNCGWRRGEARVDYETRIMSSGQPATAGVPAGAAAAPNPQWTPVVAIGAIAVLGVMLLLGVLIGKKDNTATQTVAAQAPATTTTAAAPTATTAATGANNKPAKAAAAGTTPGQGAVIQGGSGKIDPGVAAANNASTLQNAKNGPDVVATQGAPPPTDNKPAGGGSGAACIGC
jgi:hypothetical protein